ncbi:divergent PAP2 family protein [bacterium]|nr:divergent PAP2 family protein [bacterium]
MPLIDIIRNPVFIAVIVASLMAQILKMPLEYLRTKEWNWSLLFSTGGMPSSHSAVVTAAAVGVGHYMGFDTPMFGLAFAVASVVIYDATNVRRQAGFHAQRINHIFKTLIKGEAKPVNEFGELSEMLGHSPLEAIGGVILGIAVSIVIWLIWP